MDVLASLLGSFEMLAARIIPTILSKNGNLVKGEGFAADRICGNALQAARIHAMRGVDELLIFDLSCEEPNYDMVRSLTETSFTPVTVGGGIKTVQHAQRLLRAGADKVCIKGPEQLVEEISKKFGSQCVALSIEMRDRDMHSGGEILYASKYAGELIIQSVDRDGTMVGYDLDLIADAAEHVGVPIVASGGCSGYEDMYDALDAGASAVAVGALFQFTDCTPKGAAEYLNDRGVEVRL